MKKDIRQIFGLSHNIAISLFKQIRNMGLRIYSILILTLIIGSCSDSKKSNTKDASSIGNLLSKLKAISSGFQYNLILQDGEGCYKTSNSDSLYFPEYISLIGYLPDTSKYYSILYLEPGDDLFPSLKVFSKSGKVLDSKSIAYGNCAAGNCEMDSCVSIIKLIDKSSIERSMLMINTKCDSLGNKIGGETVNFRKNQAITVGPNGDIKFEAEKAN